MYKICTTSISITSSTFINKFGYMTYLFSKVGVIISSKSRLIPICNATIRLQNRTHIKLYYTLHEFRNCATFCEKVAVSRKRMLGYQTGFFFYH